MPAARPSTPPAVPDNRFEELFDQAPVSIQILAPDGRTLRVNRAWQELWQIHDGSAVHAYVLGPAYNVVRDPQVVASGIAQFLERALAGESVVIPAMRYDVGALGAAGPARWVTARAHPIKDAAGSIVEVMLMHEDISERVEAERALREQDRRKDEFLAMLAHELRNPLAPISAAADMLRHDAGRVDHVRKASEVIARQVRHLSSLVDDLLDVSRVTRGLIELHRAEVDVMAVVASAVEQSRPLIEARCHVLAVQADGDAAILFGDFNRLVQVLVNLLNNACKYTPRGGRIALAVVRGPATVAISVRDNGIGLDGALLPHVFELFTQAERTPDRSQGGLGIGLALVKNIVAMHGGTVVAHSDGPGTGSVFTVTLALRDA